MGDTADETLKRIQAYKGMQGVIVITNEGIPIRSTLDTALTVQYAALVLQLYKKAKSAVYEADSQNELVHLRIRSKKNEIIVAPGKEYIMIGIQQDEKKSVD